MAKYNFTVKDGAGSISVEAVLNKLGGVEGAICFLRGDLELVEVIRPWREENGIIYFSVTSDGTAGPEWIKRLEERGTCVCDWAKFLICSTDFQPTAGVTTEIAVLKGNLFDDADRVTDKIRAKATELGFTRPNPEVACLIREKLSDKQIEAMGLWWIVCMHEPIQDSEGVSSLLGVDRLDDGASLSAEFGKPDDDWGRDLGFVFALSQVSS